MKLLKKMSVVALGLLVCGSAAHAGVVTGWDMANVTVTPAPYTAYETYPSYLFNDAAKTGFNGVITWKESDVQAPGMQIINGDDVDGSNCIMTTGWNPEDFSDKMCTDPLKSSKRWKIKAYYNGVIDVQFNVADGPQTIYRSFQKITDGTDVKWEGFRAEVGFMVNGQFVQSTSDDGLGFSDTRGKYFSSTTSYQQKDDTLSAMFAQGLAGAPDKYHPDPGYFDPAIRYTFELLATEDSLQTGAQSSNYTDLFGPWNNADDVPFAYYYDDDNDPNTDNVLMANCDGTFIITDEVTEEGYCDGSWVTYRSQEGLDADGLWYQSDGISKTISAALLAVWETSPIYNPGAIEDLGNLGLNYWITVADNTQWPTPNQFIMRFYPQPVDVSAPVEAICDDGIDNDLDSFFDCEDTDCAADAACSTPIAEVCTDGIDNDADGYADCADPDCAGVGGCGAEGKQTSCSDGFDNDGDGEIDCADSGCAKNKACR